MPRASEYNEQTALAICERLAEGQSLREICRSEDMPAASTAFKWLSQNEDFAERYARAKEIGIEAIAEDILDIADNASNDWMGRNDEDNKAYAFNGEHVQRARLRIDSRKWLLSKLAPKKYGDKVTQEHTGPDGGPVEISKVERVIVDPKNPDS